MDAVAIRSGGRFYHLEEPAQMAAILGAEMDALDATYAHGVTLELTPAAGVVVLGASGADLSRSGAVVRLNVGDLVGCRSRQVIIPLRVVTAGQLGSRALGRMVLRYHVGNTDESYSAVRAISYALAASPAAVTANVHPDRASAVEGYRAALVQLEAAALIGRGDVNRAAAVLDAQALASGRRASALGGRAGERLRRDAAQLRSRSALVRRARSRGAARGQQLHLNQEALRNQGY